MFIVGLLSWWYGAGWKQLVRIMGEKLMTAEDYFSIDLLLKTLFSPFRQISADTGSGGTFQQKIQAAFDQLFSRIIGAFIRVILIIVGAGFMFVNLVVDVVILAIWPLLPILPIVGLMLGISGWLPWRI